MFYHKINHNFFWDAMGPFVAKLLLLSAFLLFSSGLKAVDLNSWAEKNRAKGDAFNKYPHEVNICLLKKLDSKQGIKFGKIEKTGFDQLGGLTYVDSQSLSWAMKINSPDQTEYSKNESMLADLFLNTPCHVALETPSSGKWNIYFYDKESKKPNKILSATPPKKKGSLRSIHHWLISKLGFQGIVIDINADELLVLADIRYLKPTFQGIILSDSHDRLSFTRRIKTAADALVEVVSVNGNLAVVKTVLSVDKNKAIPAGSKIYFGKQ